MRDRLYKAAVTAALVFVYIVWMEVVALLIVGMAKLVIWLTEVPL